MSCYSKYRDIFIKKMHTIVKSETTLRHRILRWQARGVSNIFHRCVGIVCSRIILLKINFPFRFGNSYLAYALRFFRERVWTDKIKGVTTYNKNNNIFAIIIITSAFEYLSNVCIYIQRFLVVLRHPEHYYFNWSSININKLIS